MKAGLLLLLMLATGVRAGATAADDQAFWLWAGVRPQPVLRQATELYLYQGEVVQRMGNAVWMNPGLPVSRVKVPALWLTIRLETLALPDTLLTGFARLCRRWQAAGNRVKGIQIDFDAGSYQLAGYAGFLRRVRSHLPPACGLSVTGLLDWASTGDVRQLNTLPVDEIVVQTYQGRQTVPRYRDYLPALLALRLPFRIGIIQHGDWAADWQQRLAVSAYYRGNVMFLVND